MAGGQVWLKSFLNKLHGRPMGTNLTPEEYEAVKELTRIVEGPATPARKAYFDYMEKKEKKGKTIMKGKIRLEESKQEKTVKEKKKKNETTVKGLEFEKVDLPAEYMEFVAMNGGSELKLLMGKRLTKTDISSTHDRVTMPCPKMWTREFLRPQEAGMVARSRMGLMVFGPSMEEHQMYLTTWNKHYSLYHGWRNVVQAHTLQSQDAIQLWSFRVDDSLCFLVHKVRNEQVIPLRPNSIQICR